MRGEAGRHCSSCHSRQNINKSESLTNSKTISVGKKTDLIVAELTNSKNNDVLMKSQTLQMLQKSIQFFVKRSRSDVDCVGVALICVV